MPFPTGLEVTHPHPHRHCRHCVFSDETFFRLFSSGGRTRVRRQGDRLVNACITPMVGNRGTSVMVWGAIHHGLRSELVVLDGTLNRHCYNRIMDWPRSEPHWTYLGAKWGYRTETWMTSFHCDRIAACCPPSVGYSSPKEGTDHDGEHATSCSCSSRHQRESHNILVVWWHGCKHV